MTVQDPIEEIGLDECRESHAWLSPVDLRFREVASGDDALLRRTTFRDLDGNPMLKYTPQSWPTFADRSRLRDLARVSVGLSRLVRAVPERVFHRDPARISSFYGVEERLARTVVEAPDGIAGAIARGDFVCGPDGFQCLEINITGNLSGWENGLLAGTILAVEPVALFVAEAGAAVTHRDTFRRLLAHALLESRRGGAAGDGGFHMVIGTRFPEAARKGGARIEEGGVSGRETSPDTERFLALQLQAVLRKHAPGVDGTLAVRDYSELEACDGVLYDGDRRVHALLEWHQESPGSTDPAVLRCFQAGNLKLYDGPASVILNDKRNLALLSERADSDLFSPEESALIRAHLPRTWRVIPDAPLEELSRERSRFVLKKGRSVGGKDVVIGRLGSDADWREAIAAALEAGDWIAQEHVESRPFLYQSGERGCSVHDAVWGPFVFGDRYAGAILKVQPRDVGGAVNLWRGATEGIVLEVDDGTPPLP